MMNAREFLGKINKKDDVIIIFHNDTDGMSSAAILSKFVSKRTGKKPLLISQPMPVDANLIDKIKTGIPSKILITDLAIDQQDEMLKKIAGFANVLVVDHHIITKKVSSKRITYYNPRSADPEIYLSASYICYDLCSSLEDMDDAFWLACVGAVADYNLDNSRDLVKKAQKKYRIKDIKNSNISKIGEIMMAGKAAKAATCEEIACMVSGFNDCDEFMASPQTDAIRRSYEEIEAEIQRVVSEASEKAEGNVLLYEIKPKFNIRSPVSTIISERNRRKLVIVYERSGSKIKISSRNQDKNLNAGKILEQAAKAVGGQGGGHEAAAGATIPEKAWKEFVERVVDMANK